MALKKRGLQDLLRRVPQALERAAKDTAQAALQIRNPLVPVDTGDLLDSGEVLAGPKLGHWIMREGAGLSDARARFTEYGTSKQAAQPHMTPAAEQAKPILRQNVAKQVKALAGKVRP
jgi:HK97 gp10 family phage protein